MINKKWINKIDNAFKKLKDPRGVIITEEDPFGEESWDETKGFENCYELLREILPHTKFKEESIEIAKLDQLIGDTETNAYGTKSYIQGEEPLEAVIKMLNNIKGLLKKTSIDKIKVLGPSSRCVTWSVDI